MGVPTLPENACNYNYYLIYFNHRQTLVDSTAPDAAAMCRSDIDVPRVSGSVNDWQSRSHIVYIIMQQQTDLPPT